MGDDRSAVLRACERSRGVRLSLTILTVAYPLSPVGPASVGGAEQVVAALDRALVHAGHRSIVIACEGSQVAGTLVPTPAFAGELDEETRRAAHEATRTAIRKAVREFEPDVIHLHGVDFCEYLPEQGPAVLATLHLPPDWYPASTFALGRTDTFLHCVSESQERSCPYSADLLPPIPNGVPLPDGLDVRKRDYVLAMGRICPEKGFHLAIDAAQEAGLPIVLAGGLFAYAAHQEYFRTEIEPRLAKPNVFFAGAVGGERKQRLLASARCVVIPSLVAETSSLVAMEAAASGTPVVAFPSGALPELVANGNTGLLVERADALPDALRRADQEVSPDACRAWAEEHFSEERMAQRYLGTYVYLKHRPGYEVEAVSDSEEWERLFEESERATPFQHPAWLRGFPSQDRLLLQVRRHGRVVGLAPLRIADGVVRFLGEGISDYLDLLASPGEEQNTARATLEWLRRHQFGCEFTDVPAHSALRDAAPDERGNACPVLDLLGSEIPARVLKSLRTAARGLDVQFESAVSNNLEEYMDALFRLHAKRWEGRGEPGVLRDSWVQTFHRRTAAGLSQAGLLRFYGMRLEGQLISILYCFAAKGRTYYYLGGFDSEYARHSPGALLVHYAIERAREEGCNEFDFLRGGEAYKYRWGAKDRWNYTVRLQALT